MDDSLAFGIFDGVGLNTLKLQVNSGLVHAFSVPWSTVLCGIHYMGNTFSTIFSDLSFCKNIS